jgi:hypothetical protein
MVDNSNDSNSNMVYNRHDISNDRIMGLWDSAIIYH